MQTEVDIRRQEFFSISIVDFGKISIWSLTSAISLLFDTISEYIPMWFHFKIYYIQQECRLQIIG